ncbi:MAG: hypothetical protein R2769_01410 [Saprospiraceae bacterium]
MVTHGYTSVFAKWLRDKGLNAASVQTEYEGDAAEENDTGEAEKANALRYAFQTVGSNHQNYRQGRSLG